MKSTIGLIVLTLLLHGCEEERFPICLTGECEGLMVIPGSTPDINGYHHLKLNWSGSAYPVFNIYVEASKIIERCQYNHVSVVEATFDTDTYWIMGDSLSVVIPLYNKFSSNYSSPYWSTPIPIGNRTIILNQYAGLLVPVVQTNTRIYLSEYFPGSVYQKPDEYKPSDPDKFLWSKRIAGPISPLLKGDTTTIFMRLDWDCGSNSVTNDKAELKIIFE